MVYELWSMKVLDFREAAPFFLLVYGRLKGIKVTDFNLLSFSNIALVSKRGLSLSKECQIVLIIFTPVRETRIGGLVSHPVEFY